MALPAAPDVAGRFTVAGIGLPTGGGKESLARNAAALALVHDHPSGSLSRRGLMNI